MATRKASCNCGKLSVTYDGPDPERISLCQCNECQRRTGSVLSGQARLPGYHAGRPLRNKGMHYPADRRPSRRSWP